MPARGALLLLALTAACSTLPVRPIPAEGWAVDCWARSCWSPAEVDAMAKVTAEVLPGFDPTMPLLIEQHCEGEVLRKHTIGGRDASTMGETISVKHVRVSSRGGFAHELVHVWKARRGVSTYHPPAAPWPTPSDNIVEARLKRALSEEVGGHP